MLIRKLWNSSETDPIASVLDIYQTMKTLTYSILDIGIPAPRDTRKCVRGATMTFRLDIKVI